jgi:hypothetical protein
MIIDGLIAFAVMFVLDFIWALYTQYVVARRHWAAALAATGIMLCNGAVTLLYVSEPLLLGFAAAGAFVGTAAAIKWKH